MDNVYRVLQPAKFLKEYVSHNTRPDGRGFEECKAAIIHSHPISTADGSCIIILGDTKICCGVKLELTTPTVENPKSGFIVTNLELPSLCSPLFKPGAPGDLAQSCNQLLADIFNDSKCIDLEELCIAKEKLVWVLYCDLVCINFGGSIIDAAVMALMGALKTVQLPVVEYNPTTENCVVHEDKRLPLNIKKIPVATTFTVFESKTILANPTYEEEEQCGGTLGGTTIVWGLNFDPENKEKELLQGVHQLGSSPLPQSAMQRTILIAHNRAKQIRELTRTVLQSTNEIHEE
ncbi:exosome complex component RRP43-like [Arctopsyche grandis]|uniref:exosome complex component RRP43-like n=1 Tax=Arctopsyche grandis TaxID=121162 RepID=UPI00406D80F3